MVRRERRRIEPAALDQPEQLRRGVRVHERGGDRHVADPERLEVERHALPVHADVRDTPSGPDQLGAELERVGHAHRLDGHVDAEPSGHLHHLRQHVLVAVVHGHVRTELERLGEAGVGQVDRDDATGRVQLRGHDRGQPDRAGTDDRNGVTGLDATLQHADLVGRGKDVGDEQHLLVAEALGDLVDRRVGERHAGELRLEAVDQMPEDPAAAADAEAVLGLLAEAAAPAGGDARDEDAVADGDGGDGRADLDDGADGLVSEDRPGLHRGDVALQDVEVRAADRRCVDPYDGVRRVDDGRVGSRLPGPLTGPVVDECLHG